MALNVIVASLLLLAAAGPASAESFSDAEAATDGRLERALRDLAQTRERIAKEKIPLSRSVSKLEDNVLTLRAQRERLLKLRDSRTVDLSSLRNQVQSLEAQESFVNSRLNEFIRDFESRLDISEFPLYEEQAAAARLAESNVNLTATGKRAVQTEVVRTALDRLREQLGGQTFPGEALSPDGVLTQGTFVAFGPTVFFASSDGSVTGLVENQLNAADPVVVALPEAHSAGILAVASNGRGVLPFDATLGKALKVEKARKSLLEYVEEGGIVGYVIVALGISALLLTLFKCVEIMGFPVAQPDEIDGVLDDLAKGDSAAAVVRASDVEGVAGQMLATGIEHADEHRAVLEELLFEQVLRVRPGLERFLPFLAITAAAAPLLGLLGTVIGMIKTFQLITIFGTGDAKSLSSGISEALVTTALGLIVAIPTLILHGALSRMARRKLGLLEELSAAFVNGITTIRRAKPVTNGAAPRNLPEHVDG